MVWEVGKVGLERWLASVDYSRRQAVERLYSRFKLVFGGRVHGRTFESVVVEVGHKVELLNHYARQLQSVKHSRGATLRRKGDDFYNNLDHAKNFYLQANW
ncbi:MAG: hypothetical protein ACTSU5_19080 [Promethearchaeota archaeon]